MEDNPAHPEIHVTNKQVAQLFGITTATVKQWGVPISGTRGRTNTYLLSEILKYRIGGPEDIDQKKEEARLAKYKADLAEIDLKHKQGESVIYSEIVKAMSEAMTVIKSLLLSLPTSLAVTLEGSDKRKIFNTLTAEFEIILTEAADIIDGTHDSLTTKKK